ncbi:MAG: formylglycine-generating enzyme family protein [Thermodesulfobacteriota bacterium]
MRRSQSTIFFFFLVVFSVFAMVRPVFSAEAPPPPGSMEGDDELGLGERLKEEKPAERIVKPEDLPPIKMVYIKGGCFKMGDWTNEGDDDERPAHEVCVSDYYMQDTEVTQELFEAVFGGLPAVFYDKKLPGVRDPKKPVTFLSYHEVVNFVNRLNKITDGYYRIPTEAEWEYAARSGGRQEEWPGLNNEAEIKDYAFFEDNSDDTLQKVRMKKPNGLGLYDMAGNVWEWCEDYFDFDYYQNSPKKDPYGVDFSMYRSVRGGSFADPPFKLRTTYRYALEPTRRYLHVGFRLAE